MGVELHGPWWVWLILLAFGWSIAAIAVGGFATAAVAAATQRLTDRSQPALEHEWDYVEAQEDGPLTQSFYFCTNCGLLGGVGEQGEPVPFTEQACNEVRRPPDNVTPIRPEAS